MLLRLAFWGLLAVPAWALAGYHGWMLMRVRFRRIASGPEAAPAVAGLPGNGDHVPAPGSPTGPAVTVVIAARNEMDRIVARVENILEGQDYADGPVDVLVVSNGTDQTLDVCERAFGGDHRVRTLSSPPEEGKAGSLNRGVAATESEIIVFADARQAFEADTVSRLVAWFGDPDVGAVSGRLVIETASDTAVRGVGSYWGLETRLREAESRTGSVIGCTGAVYAIRRELFVPLPPAAVLDDVLTPMRIALNGHAVKYDVDAIARDVPSESAGREFERKVRTLAGNLQILRLEPRLLSPFRNPLFFRYLSHRVLRLAAPWCLVLVTVLGAFLPWIPYRVVSATLAALYALGALGLLTGVGALSPFAGFLVVNAAAVLALWRWIGSRGDLWKPTS